MVNSVDKGYVSFEDAIARFVKVGADSKTDIMLTFSNLTEELQSIVSDLGFEESQSILELRSELVGMLKLKKKDLDAIKPKLLELLKLYLLTTSVKDTVLDRRNDPAVSVNPKGYLDLDFFVSKSAHNGDEQQKNKISRINIGALIILLMIYLESGFKKGYDAVMNKLLTRAKNINFTELLELFDSNLSKEPKVLELTEDDIASPFEKLATELGFVETDELRNVRIMATSLLQSNKDMINDKSSEFWKYMNTYLDKGEQLFLGISDNETSDKMRFGFTLMQAMIFKKGGALNYYDTSIQGLLDELYDIGYEDLSDRVIELDKSI